MIEFKNVFFSYTKDNIILNNISFHIPVGSKISIVGESGCGKSTILKLISGLYCPTAGDIYINGIALNDSSLHNVRQQISYIPQQSQLFPFSIYDNITCGHDIPSDVINNSCEIAQLTKLLTSLPNGLNTIVGEGGNTLSGGEKQRISIARALSKDFSILLMDEATSALDSETENKIMNYIDSLRGNKTIINVTHKLKNAVNSDIIFYFKDNKIIESGTHTQLINLNGYYSKLYQVQNILEVL